MAPPPRAHLCPLPARAMAWGATSRDACVPHFFPLQMLLVFSLCAIAAALTPSGASGPTGPWSNLPSGGGDYSLGTNYAPYYQGAVAGDAQDVDNDNNNNE